MQGIGSMLHYLSGGSPRSASDFYGKCITAAEIAQQELRLTFEDGVRLRLWDNGQSCCESRYMTCDDDVQSIVGNTLAKIEVKEGPQEAGEYGESHEVAFLEIQTSGGFITVATHNEHNGYYGGFGLSLDVIEAAGE